MPPTVLNVHLPEGKVTRKVIERAKGMLMARLNLSEEAAFRMLQKTSMDQNRRMVDVAEATLSLPDEAFAQLAASRHD